MKPSKNAVVQAVKRLQPITRTALFRLFSLPHTMTTHNRYWSESYNILPWERRTEAERSAATESARNILARLEGGE